MGIIRVVRKKGRYLHTDAEPYLNELLSWEARGMHAYMMTKPDDWEIRTNDLIHVGPAGRDKVQRIINELKKFGYMSRDRVQGDKGKFKTITYVYESQELNPIYGGTENDGQTVTGFSGDGSTVTGSTVDGKPVDIPITDLNNIYKGDPKNFDWLEHDDIGHQGSPKEAVNSMVTTLTSICKGFANILLPDSCEFHQTANILLENEITEDDVMLFGAWWNEHGHYPGKPAIKSLRDNIENYTAGVINSLNSEMTVWNTILDWTNRRVKTEDLDQDIKKTIGKVGESYLRTLNSSNERYIKSKVLSTYKEVTSE